MIRYVLRRFLSIIPMLLATSALVFLLMYMAPGDFLSEARNSKEISPEIVRQEEIRLGLDKPWYVQYARWLNGVSPVKSSLFLPESEKAQHSVVYFGKPDFGYSWSYKIPVSNLLWQRIPATLALAFASLFATYLIAIPLGALAAMYKNSAFDKITGVLSYICLSVPYFFLALLAVLAAALTGWLPTGGQTSIQFDFLSFPQKVGDFLTHLILPTAVLSIGSIASLTRIMRGNFLDYSNQEFVTTARAKGVGENAIALKHILRNALNPLITSFGFALSGILSGALLIENVMNYPGLGQLVYTAILKQDQFVVMAGVVIGCVMLVVGQLVADILLAVCDPRIRLENEKIPYRTLTIILSATALVCAALTYFAECKPLLFAYFANALKYACIALLCALVAAVVVGLLWGAIYFIRHFLKPILKSKKGALSLAVLLVMYFSAAFSQFLSPYAPERQNLNSAFAPPTKIVYENGSLWAVQYKRVDVSASTYIPVSKAKIKFFAEGSEYNFWGMFKCKTHLFGTENPNDRVFLLGTDSTGRCVFTRLLYGAVISLSIGFIGIAITLVLGFVVGGLSGYFGGAIDFVCMRFVEFLMAVPSLYLLLAMRSALAPHFSSGQMYAMIIIILSALGWAGAARVIRGMALSLRKRQYVQAAICMGQNPLRVIVKHFLPNMLSYLIVSAMLSIPAYILGEAALSFLGLGIQEPAASWGLMLSQAQNDTKVLMLGFWWLLLPGVAIFAAVLAFSALGDIMRDIADPKK